MEVQVVVDKTLYKSWWCKIMDATPSRILRAFVALMTVLLSIIVASAVAVKEAIEECTGNATKHLIKDAWRWKRNGK